VPVEAARRIVAERAAGGTFQEIADAPMADGIPSAGGKTLLVSGHHPRRPD
jgi:hypothetical protein